MICNIINLPRRQDRRKKCIEEFEKQKATFIFWPGVTGPTPRLNIHHAHKAIVRWAKENKHPLCTIAEDDVCFPAEGAYQYYIDSMPETFDIYFGATSSGTISEDKTIKGILTGMFLYTIKYSFYDKFLSAPEHKYLDYAISSLNGLYKVCYPFCCTVSPGYSDARGMIVNDSKYFKGRKLFPGPI